MLRRVAVLTGACAAVMLAARTVGADVMIGQEWTPVANENGYTYYDGFTSYSGNGLAQVVLGGNPCLQLDITNPYWGQSTGQMWANPNLTTANFNSNPRLEFDLDLSQWHWGNVDYKIELGNDNGSGGTEGGQGSTAVGMQLGYLTVPLPSGTGNPIVQHVSVDLSSILPRNPAASWMDVLQYFNPNYWGYWDSTLNAWIDTGNGYTAQRLRIDNLRLTSDPQKINGSWNVDADGNWSDSANWAGPEFATGGQGLPNGAGHTANFSPLKHTYSPTDLRYTSADPIGGHNIALNVPVTLGVLNFYNASTYTLNGPNTLTITGAAGVPAAINVAAGSHMISAPLSFTGDTKVTISPAASSLSVANLQPTSGVVTKAGDGALVIDKIQAGALDVSGGAVSLAPGRSTAKTSVLGGLTIASGGKLDLGDNDLVIHYSGTSPLPAVQSAIASGYNSGAWTGSGLSSAAAASESAALHKTALGYAEASQALVFSNGTAQFSGVTINQGSEAVLVRYTYAGDANINGVVDLSDFTFLAANFNKPSGATWQQGDFNYDGKVDLTDFTFLASNFNQNLPASVGSVVPEPASLAAIGAGLALLMRRRRGGKGAGA